MGPHLAFATAVAAASIVLTAATAAGGDRLVELRTGGQVHEGRVLSKGRDYILLEDRAGGFDWVPTPAVTAYRKVSSYRPYTRIEFKDALVREFGREREVTASRHFVVCGPAGRTKAYIRLLDEVYASFERFFRIRGVRLHAPERAMPMVVFPTRAEFDEYSVGDTGSTSPTLMGYYLPLTNRVALYEQPDRRGGVDETRTRDTLIHEAVHQLGFNTGLHARLGENPKWVVEGLAMIFESPGVRTRQPSARAGDRVNFERLARFDTTASRRPGAHLDLVRGDDRFNTHTLDAYAEAWGLNFYLLEKKSVAYARYIQKVATRDTAIKYTADAREKDFTDAFGRDTKRFEADYLKFIDRLKRDR
ncbi:MAG: DUF1570 domain-containing protein [Planctomycetota bacterium]